MHAPPTNTLSLSLSLSLSLRLLIPSMGNYSLGSCLSYEEKATGEHSLDSISISCSDEIQYPKWDWQRTSDFPMLGDDFSSIDYYFPSDLFQDDLEFPSMFVDEIEPTEWNVRSGGQDNVDVGEGEGGVKGKGEEVAIEIKEHEKESSSSSSSSRFVTVRGREERVLTFEEVSRYFYMPITQAAKELNVGLTLLKKKCRELGIPRWPHRKMKSLQTLIRNVQELGRDGRGEGEEELRCALEILEQERKLMEKIPALQMEEKTKRLRQACFKANYKKRRLVDGLTIILDQEVDVGGAIKEPLGLTWHGQM